MSKYLNQMKNELIADLTVENNLLKNSNKVLINQKTLLHKRVQELDEVNKEFYKLILDLKRELASKQMIWTNDGM